MFYLYNLEAEKLILLGFSALYFAGLFIIAGIDKERIQVQKKVLLYTITWLYFHSTISTFST